MEEVLAEFVEVYLLRIAEFDALGDLLEVSQLHLEFLRLWIVKGSLKHQGCIGQQIHALSIAKVLWPVPGELLAEFLHDSVDLLAFAWNSESIQQDLEGVNEFNIWVGEVKLIDIAREHILIELVASAQVLSYRCRTQGRRLLEEPANLFDLQLSWLRHQVSLLLEVLQAILWFQIELASCLAHLRLEYAILHLLLGVHGLAGGHLVVVLLLKHRHL